MAEKSRQIIADLRVRHGVLEVQVSATIGVAEIQPQEAFNQCLARADQGRNCVP